MTPEEQHRRDMAEIRATLAETAKIQQQQAKLLRMLAERQDAFQDKLDDTEHHLNVLIQITDGMIREQVQPGRFAQLVARVEDLDAKVEILLQRTKGA